jgi:deoxycytidylate deaminase
MIGPCAKRRMVATVVAGEQAFTAENLCWNAQETCPREPGEGYEKCQSICQQMGHGEERAIGAALLAGADVRGATCYVGHHYACAACESLANKLGVRLVFTAPVDSERTK